jgi:hypothetical protein
MEKKDWRIGIYFSSVLIREIIILVSDCRSFIKDSISFFSHNPTDSTRKRWVCNSLIEPCAIKN